MKIMGLDLGSKTLGVAVSDSLGIIATPLGKWNIETNNLQDALSCVTMLVKEHRIEKVVLGLPKNMDGSIGFQAQYTLEFQRILEEELQLEVIMIDERLTSKMAHQTMLKADMNRKKRKNHVDKLAATIILQAYLDGQTNKK
ncbi:MAG: Holliday junction resolvase RuvX [Bacilli bacterium]|jgi:putative Holliday junction resolvase|nr:Holliday junction resolvase RuvX [Bacilli bacterium]MDY0064457.1 Holliday junction resolvase RuvX [Bacilli bacterium]